ncbi:MAG: MATE family efflux transporter [Eubacteriales bacterium]|nr:MATE family efflux transporter [Eubacteriales bacterium]
MIRKQFLKMIIGQILVSLSVTICTFIDGAMIGKNLGPEAIAAFGLSLSVVTLFSAVGGTVAAGVQVVIGHAVGSGDRDELNQAFSTSVILCIILSLLSLVGTLAFLNPLVSFLGAEPGSLVEVHTRQYLIGFALGCPAFIAFMIINPFYLILGKQSVVLMATLIMSITDIIGDIANVFVFHGGSFGMSLASSVSYVAAFLYLIAFFPGIKDRVSFAVKGFNATLVKALLVAGSAFALNQICRVFFSVFANRVVISAGGDELLAAFTISKNVYIIFQSAGLGIAAATLLITGVIWGERNRASIEEILRAVFRYSLIINLAIIVVVELSAGVLCKAFLKGNVEILEASVTCLRIYILGTVLFSVNSSLRSFYQGIGKMALSQGLCVLQMVVIPVALLLGVLYMFNGNPVLLWSSLVIAEVVTFGIILLICIIKNKRVMRLHKALVLGALEDSDNEPYVFHIRSEADAVSASREIFDIYKKTFPGGRNSMKMALCVEEIGMNYIRFGREKKSSEMEVRFLISGERLRLECRDDGSVFDPCEYMKEPHAGVTEESDGRYIGLYLVFNIASDIKYINVMGLNSLIIEMEERQ